MSDKYQQNLRSVRMDDSITSRISADLKDAVDVGDLEGVINASFVESSPFMTYSQEGQPVSQLLPHHLEHLPDIVQRIAPLYNGMDDTGQFLKPEVDHGTATAALVSHYSHCVYGEMVRILADADSLYMVRDTPSGIGIQTRINLAELLAVDTYRTVALICQREDEAEAAAFRQRMALVERQLRQALRVVVGSMEAANTLVAITGTKNNGGAK